MRTQGSFVTVYGHGLVAEVATSAPAYTVITMQEIWPVVQDDLERGNLTDVLFVTNSEVDHLEHLLDRLDEGTRSIVGVGGGSVADAAKYLAWKSGLPLFQVVSTVATNAVQTHVVATRNQGRIHYVGNAVPEVVAVDFDLIQQAPVRLNRAGIGDALCGHTALFDWKLADRRGVPPKWNGRVAAARRRRLEAIKRGVGEIRKVSETGIRLLMESHRWTATAAWKYRHSRANHSSEHFFAYNFERLTGMCLLHGELVSLGIVLMSALQGNAVDEIRDVIDRAGVLWKPDELGITWPEITLTLKTLRDYVIEEQFYYTIIQETTMTDGLIDSVRAVVQ
jgi:glycerol-1-phosphate dehydrogenase [NAD(P)+]